MVTTVEAKDYDTYDNARIKYSIVSNAIDSKSGSPVFKIDEDTGEIKTNVCCLDREETDTYSIIVQAKDAGWLKRNDSVFIRVNDVNDNPPVFAREEWLVEIDESSENSNLDEPILLVNVADEDLINDYHYKVMESSGLGSEKFQMITNMDGTASLKVIKPLDYEDLTNRKGLRFKIQVTDRRVLGGKHHDFVAFTWVKIKLRDINDNQPIFEKNFVEIDLYESLAVGEEVTRLKASDLDEDQTISYSIDRESDRQRHFHIDDDGRVTLQRTLDRETQSRHQLKIIAEDSGIPATSSTAMLTVNIKDVNDNAPRFLKNYRPVIPENSSPCNFLDLFVVDDDLYKKGNGYPFKIRLDPAADETIRSSFKVESFPDKTWYSEYEGGQGMAVVSALRSFDREDSKEYKVPIEMTDSGDPAMTATATLTVIIGDANDNRMYPGQKDIKVYKYLVILILCNLSST